MLRNRKLGPSSLRVRKIKKSKPLTTLSQMGGGRDESINLEQIKIKQESDMILKLLETPTKDLVMPAIEETESVLDIDNDYNEPTQGFIQNNIRGSHKHPIHKLKKDLLKKYST